MRRDAHPNHARCRAVTGQHCRVGPSTTRAQTSGIGRGRSTKLSDEDTSALAQVRVAIPSKVTSKNNST